jgi:hypothetical protein
MVQLEKALFSDNSEQIASNDIGKMEVKNFESVPDGALKQFHWRGSSPPCGPDPHR